MEETKTENTEHSTEHTAVVAQKLPKEPEMTEAGLRIFPTSFLPEKSLMEPSRIPTAKMTGFQIEVVHVVIFFALSFFLFYTNWKRTNKR